MRPPAVLRGRKDLPGYRGCRRVLVRGLALLRHRIPREVAAGKQCAGYLRRRHAGNHEEDKDSPCGSLQCIAAGGTTSFFRFILHHFRVHLEVVLCGHDFTHEEPSPGRSWSRPTPSSGTTARLTTRLTSTASRCISRARGSTPVPWMSASTRSRPRTTPSPYPSRSGCRRTVGRASSASIRGQSRRGQGTRLANPCGALRQGV